MLEGRPLCTCFSRLYHFSSIRLLSGGYVALFSDMFFVHAGIMMFLSSRKTSDFISILSLIGKFCCSLGRKYVCFLSPCSSVGFSCKSFFLWSGQLLSLEWCLCFTVEGENVKEGSTFWVVGSLCIS